MSLRTIANRVLRARGLELSERYRHPQRHAAVMELLQRRRFSPGTVIDIGVATGTPWLYEPFAQAQLVLIDPNPVFTDALSRLRDRYGAHVYAHAVGATAGEVVLHSDSVAPSSSSLLPVSATLVERWSKAGVQRQFTDVRVPMLTLDATLAGVDYRTPFLLKIDTEGYEREVLLGATATLSRTDVVVAEVSVVRRFEGSYEFAELIALLDARGFRLYDLLDVTPFGSQGPINYVDAAFVRRGSILDNE